MDEDLSKYLRRNKKINQSDVNMLLKQIVDAIDYLHSKKVFHRDLKPQNILINKANHIKVADFGLGRIVSKIWKTMSKEIETLWYRAPELLLGNLRYDFEVDVWSVGCIFFELAEGHILFQTESEIGQIMEIMRQQGTPSIEDCKNIIDLPYFRPTFPKFRKIRRAYSNLDPLGIDLLEKMLEINPKRRITIEEAKAHPYFTQ